MKFFLVCRDCKFFFIDSFAYEYACFVLFAIIRSGIYGFLYGKKVSASVFGHYEIIICHVTGQFWNDFYYGRKKQLH